jgi:hypothetical protein
MDDPLGGLARVGCGARTADYVPVLLGPLRSRDAEEREQALAELYANIFHQGTRYPAGVRAHPGGSGDELAFERVADAGGLGCYDAVRARAAVRTLLTATGPTLLPYGDGIPQLTGPPGRCARRRGRSAAGT